MHRPMCPLRCFHSYFPSSLMLKRGSSNFVKMAERSASLPDVEASSEALQTQSRRRNLHLRFCVVTFLVNIRVYVMQVACGSLVG
jgi:hypothetical protein